MGQVSVACQANGEHFDTLWQRVSDRRTRSICSVCCDESNHPLTSMDSLKMSARLQVVGEGGESACE